jgi:hypothetical protein
MFYRDATVHKGSTRQCLRHFDRRGDDTFEALVLSGTIQSIDMSPKELVLPVQYLLALSCAIAPDSYGDSATTIPTGSNGRLWFYREPYKGFSRRGLGGDHAFETPSEQQCRGTSFTPINSEMLHSFFDGATLRLWKGMREMLCKIMDEHETCDNVGVI